MHVVSLHLSVTMRTSVWQQWKSMSMTRERESASEGRETSSFYASLIIIEFVVRHREKVHNEERKLILMRCECESQHLNLFSVDVGLWTTEFIHLFLHSAHSWMSSEIGEWLAQCKVGNMLWFVSFCVYAINFMSYTFDTHWPQRHSHWITIKQTVGDNNINLLSLNSISRLQCLQRKLF